MIKEIKQSDLFANAPKPGFSRKQESEVLKEAEEKTKENIPEDYIKIKLCSLGKLSAPAVLHFRNYTLGEAAELSDLSLENQYELFVKVLNKMVYEDFDCAKLHKEEIIEILLYIYSTWWSPTLELPYFVNEQLIGKALIAKENTAYARIRLSGEHSNIVIKDLFGEFKTPFNLIGPDKKKYTLRFPIVGDLIFAKNFLEIKYAEEEKFFSRIENSVKRDEIELIEKSELKLYKDFLNTKVKEGLIAERSCMLLAVDGEELTDPEERFQTAKNLPLDFWAFITKQQKEFSFGLEPEITFLDEDHKPVTRRFQFRFMDFFPSLEQEGNSGYSISFD